MNLDNTYMYHSPKGDQSLRYATLREQAKFLAESILEKAPESRERSLALTKLEESIMWANKAIACNE